MCAARRTFTKCADCRAQPSWCRGPGRKSWLDATKVDFAQDFDPSESGAGLALLEVRRWVWMGSPSSQRSASYACCSTSAYSAEPLASSGRWLIWSGRVDTFGQHLAAAQHP